MDTLCITTNLTSTELASWIQAIGTILAVVGAASIAIWQSKKQHQSALKLHKHEQRYAKLEAAKTLLALAENCSKAITHFSGQLHDRSAVHRIASTETYFDFGELDSLKQSTSGIPLHELPHALVTPAMVLGATVRQFHQTVAMAMKLHRQMDSDQFTELFKTLDGICQSLALTCGDVREAVDSVKNDA